MERQNPKIRPLSFAQMDQARTANSCNTMEELFIVLARRDGVGTKRAKNDYRDYRERFLAQESYVAPPVYITTGVEAAWNADSRPGYLREGTRMAAISGS